MKKGWSIVRLGDVCNIISGRNQKAVECANGPYPIYGSGGIMGHASDYLCEAGATIIGRKGSINNPIYVQTRFWNVDTAFGLTPKEAIISKYLFYFCKSYNFLELNKGTTIPSLVKTDLLQIRFPVPSINEQQRIVALLDAEFIKIDKLILNAKTNLQRAKDLFQFALTKELHSKSVIPLIDLCLDIVDCPHSTPIKSLVRTEYPCIRTSELGQGYIIWSSMQYVSKEEYLKRVSRLAPQCGDIVFGREGTIGNAVLIPNCYHFCLGQRTTLFRPNKAIVHPKYLLYCIISPYVYKQAMEKNNGCGVAHVNVADIKQFIIPMRESLEEQQLIISKLDSLAESCHSLQSNYSKTLALCDDLKQALLRKAFNGEL